MKLAPREVEWHPPGLPICQWPIKSWALAWGYPGSSPLPSTAAWPSVNWLFQVAISHLPAYNATNTYWVSAKCQHLSSERGSSGNKGEDGCLPHLMELTGQGRLQRWKHAMRAPCEQGCCQGSTWWLLGPPESVLRGPTGSSVTGKPERGESMARGEREGKGARHSPECCQARVPNRLYEILYLYNDIF